MKKILGKIRTIRKIHQVYILETAFYLLIIFASFIEFNLQAEVTHYVSNKVNTYSLTSEKISFPQIHEILLFPLTFCLYGIARIIYRYKKKVAAISFEYLYFPFGVFILFYQEFIRYFLSNLVGFTALLLATYLPISMIFVNLIIRVKFVSFLIFKLSFVTLFLLIILTLLGKNIYSLSKHNQHLISATYPEKTTQRQFISMDKNKGTLVEFFLIFLVSQLNVILFLPFDFIGFREIGWLLHNTIIVLNLTLFVLLLVSYRYFFENHTTLKLTHIIVERYKINSDFSRKTLKFAIVTLQFLIVVIAFELVVFKFGGPLYIFFLYLGESLLKYSLIFIFIIIIIIAFEKFNRRTFRIKGNKLVVSSTLTVMLLILAIMSGSVFTTLNSNQFMFKRHMKLTVTNITTTNIEAYLSAPSGYHPSAYFSNIVLTTQNTGEIIVDRCLNITQVVSNSTDVSVKNYSSPIFYFAYQNSGRLWLTITVNETIIIQHHQTIQLARMLNGVCVPYSY